MWFDYQLKQLLHKWICHVPQRPDHLNRDWVIDKAQCQRLVGTLCEKAQSTNLSVGSASMASMQRRGYSIVQLVLSMQAGYIEFGQCPDIDHPLSCKQFTDFAFK